MILIGEMSNLINKKYISSGNKKTNSILFSLNKMQKQFVGLWSYSIYPSSESDIKFIQFKDKHFQKVLNAALRLVCLSLHIDLAQMEWVHGEYTELFIPMKSNLFVIIHPQTQNTWVPSGFLSIKVTFHTFIQTNPFPTNLSRESMLKTKIKPSPDAVRWGDIVSF